MLGFYAKKGCTYTSPGENYLRELPELLILAMFLHLTLPDSLHIKQSSTTVVNISACCDVYDNHGNYIPYSNVHTASMPTIYQCSLTISLILFTIYCYGLYVGDDNRRACYLISSDVNIYVISLEYADKILFGACIQESTCV